MFSTKTSLIIANLTLKVIRFFVLCFWCLIIFFFWKVIIYLLNGSSLSPLVHLPMTDTIRFFVYPPRKLYWGSKNVSVIFSFLYLILLNGCRVLPVCVYKLYNRSGVTESKGVWIYICYSVKLSSTMCSVLYFYQQYMRVPAILYSC